MNISSCQAGLQCLSGTVVLTPTGAIGATTGFLMVPNARIPIRQVPGPNNRGVPLSQLNGRRATVCGQFVQDASGVTFSVTVAGPLLQ